MYMGKFKKWGVRKYRKRNVPSLGENQNALVALPPSEVNYFAPQHLLATSQHVREPEGLIHGTESPRLCLSPTTPPSDKIREEILKNTMAYLQDFHVGT